MFSILFRNTDSIFLSKIQQCETSGFASGLFQDHNQEKICFSPSLLGEVKIIKNCFSLGSLLGIILIHLSHFLLGKEIFYKHFISFMVTYPFRHFSSTFMEFLLLILKENYALFVYLQIYLAYICIYYYLDLKKKLLHSCELNSPYFLPRFVLIVLGQQQLRDCLYSLYRSSSVNRSFQRQIPQLIPT